MQDLLIPFCFAQRILRLEISPEIVELITQEIYSKQ